MKFRADTAGYITGVRFYKGAGNTGTPRRPPLDAHRHAARHGDLHRRDARAAGSRSTSPPRSRSAAGTTYVASYYAPTGHYAVNLGYFASAAYDNGPLHALGERRDGGNGVYRYGSRARLPRPDLPGEQLLGRRRLHHQRTPRHHRTHRHRRHPRRRSHRRPHQQHRHRHLRRSTRPRHRHHHQLPTPRQHGQPGRCSTRLQRGCPQGQSHARSAARPRRHLYGNAQERRQRDRRPRRQPPRKRPQLELHGKSMSLLALVELGHAADHRDR